MNDTTWIKEFRDYLKKRIEDWKVTNPESPDVFWAEMVQQVLKEVLVKFDHLYAEYLRNTEFKE